MNCSLCPRKCNSNRTDNDNLNGYCKMPLLPKVARASLHFWEEPCISGKKGSGTVFFSGCSLSCIFCQNREISHLNKGKVISVERLAEIFKELEKIGAENINLVNPTHYALTIKQALSIYKPKIPIVYNSGGYDDVKVLRALKDYVDVYLLDFKYVSAEKAFRYSNAQNYPQIAKMALLEAYSQKPKCVFENGMMKSGVIVRHLLMPQSTNDAIEAFEFVNKNMPNAYFSLMAQYIPFGDALNDKIINRRITKREYDKVLNYILDSDFKNCYIQDLKSATDEYIPNFDLTGI